jgi:hypothetical protein
MAISLRKTVTGLRGLIEGKNLPVGTISTYKNGEKKVKTAASPSEWKLYTGTKSVGTAPSQGSPGSSEASKSWSADEKAVMGTYAGKKMSDVARLKQSGLSREQFLRVSNDLRQKLAKKGEPSWSVDLSKHAK